MIVVVFAKAGEPSTYTSSTHMSIPVKEIKSAGQLNLGGLIIESCRRLPVNNVLKTGGYSQSKPFDNGYSRTDVAANPQCLGPPVR